MVYPWSNKAKEEDTVKEEVTEKDEVPEFIEKKIQSA